MGPTVEEMRPISPDDSSKSESTPLDPKQELDEPVKMPSFVDIVVLNLAWFGLNLIFLVMTVVVVPAQVQSMVGTASKGRWFGGMVAAGAVVSFILGPLVGMGSDRVISRFGKRRPIITLAMVFLCFGLAGMALSAPKVVFLTDDKGPNDTCEIDLVKHRCAPYQNYTLPHIKVGNPESMPSSLQKDDTVTVPIVTTTGSIGMFIMFNLILVSAYVSITISLSALIADKSHPSQRGINSGLMACMTLLGNISGAVLGLFFTNLGVPGVYAIACIIGVISVSITVIFTTESAAASDPGPFTPMGIFVGFWEPLKDNDFMWVFLTRFLMQQGVATVIGFLEFWLSDMVQIPNCWSPPRGVAMLLLPLLITAALSSVCGGFVSDYIQRRKPLVILSAILMCIASTILAINRGPAAFYVAICSAIIFGLGFGCFMSVDFALVMDILPEKMNKGKDIAVWHQALILPQALATPVGGILLDLFEQVNCTIGLGYIIVFIVTSVYFFLSGVFILKIRGTK